MMIDTNSNSIIATCGFEGAGKSTVAKILVENYGYTEFSFAGALKDVVAIVFSWDRALLEGNTPESREFREKEDIFWSKEFGRKITPRIVLQDVGILFRGYHTDMWSTIIKRKILTLMETKLDTETCDTGGTKIVISDLRFTNEYEMIKDLHGTVISIERDATKPSYADYAKSFIWNGKKDITNDPILKDVHVSSYTFLTFDCDYYITNNGSKLDLESNIKDILSC